MKVFAIITYSCKPDGAVHLMVMKKAKVRGGSLWTREQPERPCFNKVEDNSPQVVLWPPCVPWHMCACKQTKLLEHNFKQATIFWMLLFYSTLSSLERVTWLLVLWRTGITSYYCYLLHRHLKLWPSFITPVQRFLQRNICSHLVQQN